MKAIVFGASKNSKKLYELIKERYDIIALTDNNPNKWEQKIDNIPVISPCKMLEIDFDEVIVASVTAMYIIQNQLIEIGIDKSKINLSYVDLQVRARVQFLNDYSQVVYENHIRGNVAEAGVFQGEFAKLINERFPDRKLYLFDTFYGFDEKDIEVEIKKGFSEEETSHLNNTSEEMVLSKMLYVRNCIIKKGYFPETTSGILDTFCFVSLDMDLYKPTLEGLNFFWERMEKGGAILIHDYFGGSYNGVKYAVDEFRKEKAIPMVPMGDSLSAVIIKM